MRSSMGSRWRGLIGVLMILAGVAFLPLAGQAGAQPRQVAVTVRTMAPFVMTADNKLTGFAIELWEEIAKRQQWTTRYVPADSVAAQLKNVQDRRADVAAGAISITGERMKTFDFSQPMLSGGLQILVPKTSTDATEPSIGNFLPLLFSRTMLFWLLGGLALALIPAHITWLAERRHPDSMVSKSYFPGIFQSFIFAGETLTATQEDVPRQWFSRAFTILWGFVAIVFVSFFTATLTTTLTVGTFEAQIKGPQDLFDKKVATVAGTTSAKYLEGAGVTVTGLANIDDCYAALDSGEVAAVVFDSPVLRYYVAHEGAEKAELAGAVFQSEDYGMAFVQNSPLRQGIDESLLAIRQDGTYDEIRAKYFGDPHADG
ncbi:MAG: transporter substrate-binding domain-containing protein [Mycobacterium sp.]|nr:transporter substrate-binding domain-containing protein [Mycobacterium sp.]